MKNREDVHIKSNKEENWLDSLMERQKQDLEVEEEILSSVPNRIKQKWIDIDDE